MIRVEALNRIPLFRCLSAQGRSRLLAQARIQEYARGAVIFSQQERAEAIWVVLEGWVHLVRSHAPTGDSSGTVLLTITPREALCGLSALDSGIYNLSAVAGTACRVVRIVRQAFEVACRREPEFAHQALRLCARRMEWMARQYGAMAEPVSRRIVRAILRLQEQFGDTLPMTHRELAQMSWTTTESAIRVVRRLKERGYVDGSRGRLMIRRSAPLEQWLDHANGAGTIGGRHGRLRSRSGREPLRPAAHLEILRRDDGDR